MVARFGGESMKPIYIGIPSLSKYMQNNPNAFTAHHLAYVPKVSRVISSLQLFTYICSNKLLKNAHLVLFLSKCAYLMVDLA